MAYLSNGLQLGERLGLNAARLCRLTLGMCVVGAGLALAIALCATYADRTPIKCGFDLVRRRRPLMVGVSAAEITAAITFMLTGAV